jgi:hypothetical protein
MTVRLSRSAFEPAEQLIHDGHLVLDGRDDWSEDRPSADAESAYIEEHGFTAYARWFLGVDDDRGVSKKGRYKFPYSDFSDVHRCGVISAESRAAQHRHGQIKGAAAHLHGMLEAFERPR